MTTVHAIVEGSLDAAVAERILDFSGHTLNSVLGNRGNGYIRKKIGDFNKSAHVIPYLALVDFMDTKLDCPPSVVTTWLPNPGQLMRLRVVVREIESWLLADRHGIANFLKVHLKHVPIDPEALPDPKQSLVNLARHSRSRDLRRSIVPNPDSTVQVGRMYNSEMARYISTVWDIQNARANSPSLDSCIASLATL